MTRKLAVAKTATWSVLKRSPPTNLVRKSLARLIGFETMRSIEPLETRSGMMPAVVMSARIVATHASQRLTPRPTKIIL